MRRWAIVIVVIAIWPMSVSSEGEDYDYVRGWRSSPYCGLFAAYAAIHILDSSSTVEFEDLIDVQYLGSYDGSSARELTRALVDNGLAAIPVGGADTALLRARTDPALLHVKSSPVKEQCDHWVLFCGVEDEIALILDGPNGIREVPIRGLYGMWDGFAVLVSLEEQSGYLHGIGLRHLVRVLFLLALLPTVLWSIGRCKSGSARLLVSVSVCGVWATAYHLVDPQGLLRNYMSTEMVALANAGADLPTVRREEVGSLINDGRAVLVDARTEGDYVLGHLPNAINIPVSLDIDECRNRLAGVPSDTTVIVYCSNEKCEFARTVATKLFFDGFRNVSLYLGGWDEWSS